MIVFGICLLVLAALVSKLAVLWGIDIIVLVVGMILGRSRSEPLRMHWRVFIEEM